MGEEKLLVKAVAFGISECLPTVSRLQRCIVVSVVSVLFGPQVAAVQYWYSRVGRFKSATRMSAHRRTSATQTRLIRRAVDFSFRFIPPCGKQRV